MEYKKAKNIADWWLDYLGKACRQIQIAGSLRRQEQHVKDIELVARPVAIPLVDLFGEVQYSTYPIDDLLLHYPLVKNGPRYKQIDLREIKIDLFLVLPPAEYGVILAIRTGPKDYSKKLVTQKAKGGWLPDNLLVRDGALWEQIDGNYNHLETKTEDIFFDQIGMEYTDPIYRSIK